jgi:hypothetical protein
MGVRTPRQIHIWRVLALIALVALLFAVYRPTPQGKLRIANLRHVRDWKVAPPDRPYAGPQSSPPSVIPH